MVSISLRSFGLTMALVRPCIIAIATSAESMIGRMFFGIPLELLESPPVEFSPISLNILMHSRTSICLSCIPFTTRNSGSNHRSVGSIPCSIPLSRRVWQYIIRSSLSFAIPSPLQSAITIASFAAARSTYSILPAASAEFTIGFPLERLYTEIPASIAFLLDVSRASGTLSKLLCSSSTAHFMMSSPSFSAGPMFTSR